MAAFKMNTKTKARKTASKSRGSIQAESQVLSSTTRPPALDKLNSVVEELTNTYNESTALKADLQASQQQLEAEKRGNVELRDELLVAEKQHTRLTHENRRLYEELKLRHSNRVSDKDEIRDLRAALELAEEHAQEALTDHDEEKEHARDLTEEIDCIEMAYDELKDEKCSLGNDLGNLLNAAQCVLAHPTIQAMTASGCRELGTRLDELCQWAQLFERYTSRNDEE